MKGSIGGKQGNPQNSERPEKKKPCEEQGIKIGYAPVNMAVPIKQKVETSNLSHPRGGPHSKSQETT